MASVERSMTDEEKRNVAKVHAWIAAYNSDVAQMVREFYAPDLEVTTMGAGTYTGHAHFTRVELDVLKAAPRRRVRIDHTHAVGNVVVAELVLLNPDAGDDWALPLAAVLEFAPDGKIVRDRSYHNLGSQFATWPGLL
jgi:limonene-1,2-epoxide hydrolase